MTALSSPCSFEQLALDQLSDNEVLTKKAKIQQMGFFMLLLLVMFVSMAFVLSSYLVAASSWALIPALATYNRKRKAIAVQLQKRSLL
ncbi:hypothetical protein GCM10028806_58330 [Spirosoma terrae]|uniref:Transmembrane protein n=1 Tax=Spirosoma terrae TaxID=1968276 RepID=A0A6L9LBX0_9BACT|nr:hypothetical protein [Spirosoma terrae]NDU98055.1 hypothetical protein [Spirosoma terrae]